MSIRRPFGEAGADDLIDSRCAGIGHDEHVVQLKAHGARSSVWRRRASKKVGTLLWDAGHNDVVDMVGYRSPGALARTPRQIAGLASSAPHWAAPSKTARPVACRRPSSS